MSVESATRATREEILEAAVRVIKNEGASKLTLELVAKEAGVSKGGLLYHFPNKQELLRGLVRMCIERGEAEIEQRLPKVRTPGCWIQAYMEAQSSCTGVACESGPDGDLIWAIMGAGASDPELLDPVRSAFQRWQENVVTDGLDPAMATLLRLAADGLWSAQMFNFGPPEDGLRQSVLDLMDRLRKEAAQKS